jgi:hypothetical protein
MSQTADTATATLGPKGPFASKWGVEATRAERALAWFDARVWHEHEVCSNCFARLKHSQTVERDAWGNEDTDSWRSNSATLEHGHDPLPDPPKTTCNACGSMGGLAAFDTLSLQGKVDRVPELVTRVEEVGHDVDEDMVYGVVRTLGTDEDYEANDKEIFAIAAALGVEQA